MDFAFTVYFWLIIVRIIFSWIPLSSSEFVERIRSFVYDITEPYLRLFRRLLPMVSLGGMGLDLSPIIAIIVLHFIRRLVLNILFQFML
ncbi:MAG: YggT family protein [Actinomycetota bacterium]|nr:YggT family protein [Actinomycetota bacterium]MDI6821709.1 YggT family protein [Actinomycetota bacterium]